MKIAIVNPKRGHRTTTTRDKALRAIARDKAAWANAEETAIVYFYGDAHANRALIHGYRPQTRDYREGVFDPLWMRTFIAYPHREPLSC